MKVAKVILGLLLMIYGSSVYSQKIILGSDMTNVYNTVLNSIDFDGKKAFVIKETSMTDIANFKFDHIENYLLGSRIFGLYQDSSWNTFLKSVDILKVKNYKFYISQHPVNIKFINEGEKDFFKMLSDPIDIYGIINFSPIIFSPDTTKAVLTFKNLRPSAGISKSVFFLIRDNGIWSIENKILLEIQ